MATRLDVANDRVFHTAKGMRCRNLSLELSYVSTVTYLRAMVCNEIMVRSLAVALRFQSTIPPVWVEELAITITDMINGFRY